MKHLFRISAIGLGFLLAAVASAQAGDVTIPNTFTAGTPAVASEVNQNFAAVEAAVDDNAADISANSADIAANSAAVDDIDDALDSHATRLSSHGDRLARAYGYVNQYNVDDDTNRTDNVSSVVWNATEHRYEIIVENISFAVGRKYSLIAVHAGSGSEPRVLRARCINSTGFPIYVYAYDLSGTPVETSFYWVLFSGW